MEAAEVGLKHRVRALGSQRRFAGKEALVPDIAVDQVRFSLHVDRIRLAMSVRPLDSSRRCPGYLSIKRYFDRALGANTWVNVSESCTDEAGRQVTRVTVTVQDPKLTAVRSAAIQWANDCGLAATRTVDELEIALDVRARNPSQREAVHREWMRIFQTHILPAVQWKSDGGVPSPRQWARFVCGGEVPRTARNPFSLDATSLFDQSCDVPGTFYIGDRDCDDVFYKAYLKNKDRIRPGDPASGTYLLEQDQSARLEATLTAPGMSRVFGSNHLDYLIESKLKGVTRLFRFILPVVASSDGSSALVARLSAKSREIHERWFKERGAWRWAHEYTPRRCYGRTGMGVTAAWPEMNDRVRDSYKALKRAQFDSSRH